MAKSAAVPTSADSRSQKDIVVEVLESGIEKPSQIVELIQQKYGRDIPKPNVNQIKVQWKKRKAGVPVRANKRVKLLKTETATASAASKAIESMKTDKSGSVSELEIAKFALRLGGVDNAIVALQNLIK